MFLSKTCRRVKITFEPAFSIDLWKTKKSLLTGEIPKSRRSFLTAGN